MKKLWANIALAGALTMAVSGCNSANQAAPTPSPTASASATPSAASYPKATAPVDSTLVITVLAGNGMGIQTHNLFCSGASAVSPTDLPHANAACSVVVTSPALLQSKLQATDDKKCKATGNQVVADIFGESDGKHVRASFQRDNLCNAKVWDSLTPLVGLG